MLLSLYTKGMCSVLEAQGAATRALSVAWLTEACSSWVVHQATEVITRETVPSTISVQQAAVAADNGPTCRPP